MDFQHTETCQMLGDTLNRYFSERYGSDVRRRSSLAPGHDRGTWAQMVELGALGALFDDKDGGYGGTGFDTMVVFEALGRNLVVEPLLGNLVCGRALALAGHAARHGVVAGDTLMAFAHHESGSRDALAHVETRAQLSAGEWSLNGSKSVVLDAEACTHALVSARVSGGSTEPTGIALFIVALDAPGVTLRAYPLIDGGRAAELELRDVKLGADTLVAGPEQGFDIVEQVAGLGILALCAEGLGLMESLKTATADYLATRVQFGAPIGANQALQHRMVDLLIDIEQARSAVINAAAALDQPRVLREQALSAAKYTLGTNGIRVAEEAIQMHGGIGMTQELPAAQAAKRLIMIDHQLGDADHHLERYVALGREQ
ncbi:acyl-CoA dehydrogenase family protein [Pseudorhodoferax soli]|uniref:Alkylation response protein AidB-like acyl-CoA dehydrogenase n=1 Tax=Pseudorhodoferax soli TaxID=545864 RepID=A0A368Y5K1_9BURK|nr:acyl-CoA dehydrogenase family protein [Pseudorhodoferax soli]RCW75563.1 alkylation response protein AidB-like acyl-CoA dehydrogenase [Pseudorhodoferax soli]